MKTVEEMLEDITFTLKAKAKACPFCGKFNLHLEETESDEPWNYVRCFCGGSGPAGSSPTKAIEEWNARKEPNIK